MATYIAEADSYAGFGSTGKYFLYFGLAAGAVGLTGWASMHGLLPGLRPADAFDQLLIVAMAWVGCGLAALMVVALLLPMVPARVKEWAYAGFAITLASALIAHVAVGDGIAAWGWAAGTGVLWALSYFLWRRMHAGSGHPSSGLTSSRVSP